MNSCKSAFMRDKTRMLVVLLSISFLFLGKANCAPYVLSNDGSQVFDHATKLIWMRCHVGQHWDGNACIGKPDRYSFPDAIAAALAANQANQSSGNSAWDVPSLPQMASLRFCSNGYSAEKVRFLKFGRALVWSGAEMPALCNGAPSDLTIDSVFKDVSAVPSDDINLRARAHYWTAPHDCTPGGRDGLLCSTALVDLRNGELGGANWYQKSSAQVRHFVRLVRPSWMLNNTTPTEADKNDFWFADPVRLAAALDKARSASGLVSWDVTPPSRRKYLQVEYVQPKSIDVNILLETVVLVAQQKLMAPVQNLPKVRPEPVLGKADLNKDEFETTEQFERRKLAAQAVMDADYAEQVRARGNEVAMRTKAQAGADMAPNDAKQYQAALQAAWDEVLPAMLGNPALKNIQYNADKEVFTSTLHSNRDGAFAMTVTSAAPLKEAADLKSELYQLKIVPHVVFAFPAMSVDWSLKENALMRANSFAAQNTSLPGLLALIGEYPHSAEAADAKLRVFQLAKSTDELIDLVNQHPQWDGAASARSTIFLRAASSGELNKLIRQNAQWEEAKSAALRLPALQLKEFHDAVARDSAAAYQEFITNFAGQDTQNLIRKSQKAMQLAQVRENREQRDANARSERERPQREAKERHRNLCLAQVNTCVASCPRYYSETSRQYTDAPEFACRSRCESVSCY
ncbi:MAG: hypothetical protein V4484_18960 [Pseudomonadota bacterium]